MGTYTLTLTLLPVWEESVTWTFGKAGYRPYNRSQTTFHNEPAAELMFSVPFDNDILDKLPKFIEYRMIAKYSVE